MEIVEVNRDSYDHVVNQPFHVFGSGSFAELNSHKVDQVCYLLFKDTKFRLGITLGIKQNKALSPFSAPFGGLMNIKEDVKIWQIENAVIALNDWAKSYKLQTVEIVLPPDIYNPSFIAKCLNVFFRQCFKVQKVDLNFCFLSSSFIDGYNDLLWRNAKKNLKISLGNDLALRLCSTTQEKEAAYAIIKQNRESKGFPLRLPWDALKKTTEIIAADFFLCKTTDGTDIASAIVFHVAKEIVQVIYWGDLPEHTHLKTMNFVAYKLFEHYSQLGIKVIDIGPSTENSEANHGLCEFKESIGAMITPKISLIKELQNERNFGKV